jgi:hypothetical protein
MQLRDHDSSSFGLPPVSTTGHFFVLHDHYTSAMLSLIGSPTEPITFKVLNVLDIFHIFFARARIAVGAV